MKGLEKEFKTKSPLTPQSGEDLEEMQKVDSRIDLRLRLST